MSDLGPAPSASSTLIDRVKNILLSPTTEWPAIDAEPSSIADIYKSHVLPLAAIGPVANFIGTSVLGFSAFGITYRAPIVAGLAGAIIHYLLTLGGVYVLALIIDSLAPQFGATKNRTGAFKVAAYGATAGWIAGIFGILPALALLGLLGLYSLYLIYLGLPVVMKAPADKAAGYTAVVVLVALVLAIIVGAVAVPITRMFGPSASYGTASGGTLTLPGGASVDTGKLEEAGKKLEAAAAGMQNGQAAPATPPDQLLAMLPATLPGGLARTSTDTGSAGAAGISGSNAKGVYGSGENAITLEVTDLGAVGGLAALGGALGVQSSHQDATSYEKVGKVDGRMTTEKYDSTSKSGSYSTVVGDRFLVAAEGTAPSIDVFKAAVAAVDLGKLEGMAK